MKTFFLKLSTLSLVTLYLLSEEICEDSLKQSTFFSDTIARPMLFSLHIHPAVSNFLYHRPIFLLDVISKLNVRWTEITESLQNRKRSIYTKESPICECEALIGKTTKQYLRIRESDIFRLPCNCKPFLYNS